MVEILPAILEKTFGPIQEKIGQLRGLVSHVQLDIADNIFVPQETWQEQERLSELGDDPTIDLHLMVDRPEQWIDRWDCKNVFRLTFHFEATYDVRRTVEKIKSHQKQVGIALKINTPVNVLYDILHDIDMVLLLAVEPGRQGQNFDARVLEKIKELRLSHPNIKIGVDGGVSPIVVSSLVEAGADVLVCGSYLFSQENIEEALKSLQI